jgi:hypothetical protein
LANLLLTIRSMLLDQMMHRVRREYEELPGLRLTRWQAQRLWRLDPGECELVLTSLVRSTFLTESRDGTFVRRVQPEWSASTR